MTSNCEKVAYTGEILLDLTVDEAAEDENTLPLSCESYFLR